MPALMLAGCLLLAGCGSEEPVSQEPTEEVTPLGFAGTDITPLEADLFGGKLLGLNVTVEDVTDRLAQVDDTYVEQLTLYAFRRAELLMATLQVSRLGGPARPDDATFRRSIVNLIGGSVPREVRLGQTTVWLTTGTSQRLSAWFHDDHFFVLSTRADYERPRTLLRELLEVRP